MGKRVKRRVRRQTTTESALKDPTLQGFSAQAITNDLSAGLTKAINRATGGMANSALTDVNPVHGLSVVLTTAPIGSMLALVLCTPRGVSQSSRRGRSHGRGQRGSSVTRSTPV